MARYTGAGSGSTPTPASTAGFHAIDGSISSTPGVGCAYLRPAACDFVLCCVCLVGEPWGSHDGGLCCDEIGGVSVGGCAWQCVRQEGL